MGGSKIYGGNDHVFKLHNAGVPATLTDIFYKNLFSHVSLVTLHMVGMFNASSIGNSKASMIQCSLSITTKSVFMTEEYIKL